MGSKIMYKLTNLGPKQTFCEHVFISRCVPNLVQHQMPIKICVPLMSTRKRNMLIVKVGTKASLFRGIFRSMLEIITVLILQTTISICNLFRNEEKKLVTGFPQKEKKERKKNFSESEKYRVYVLRDNVSTMFNIVTVIILRGTNLHTKLLSNEGRVPLSFVGQHKHKYIKLVNATKQNKAEYVQSYFPNYVQNYVSNDSSKIPFSRGQ